ncbi:carbon-nitrogen hydrolase family protein [Acrocarpospora macrocephala]|uniref:Nitrilase n=1 Tax=Acrocarpospora macrocephala TaxID=150177 RepID=A0A5M3WT46_9ACTN|nr:carbon-nitrogen hydrolase family protein [Acrocarpospora macrocephala]GES10481.1 nitrilase [Acrocarpospora macrocephala]
MTTVKIAAVQAAYLLMDQKACLDKAVELLRQAAAAGAGIVVFPEVFIPGTPIWIDSRPIWDGDDDWYALLVEQAVTVPGPITDALAAAAGETGTYLVIGVNEREPHGATIYNTTLYFGPDGTLLGKHRKLMPTGSERTVWGMGDGSTLPVIDTPYGRLSGLICWENYMPLARFYLYSQGVDIWTAPTLAQGDGWLAAMRHIAHEGRCYVIGVNPCVHIDQIPADFPHRDRVWRAEQEWVEPGNSIIIDPTGKILAGPARHEETILYADIDLAAVHAARRYFDPVGHYHRPDIFQLAVDTSPRPAVVTRQGMVSASEPADPKPPPA